MKGLCAIAFPHYASSLYYKKSFLVPINLGNLLHSSHFIVFPISNNLENLGDARKYISVNPVSADIMIVIHALWPFNVSIRFLFITNWDWVL